MTNFETIEYTVCTHFLPAIFNGDESGLDPEDVEKLNEWLHNEGFDETLGHFSHDSNDESHFDWCGIVGLRGDVVRVTWNQRC